MTIAAPAPAANLSALLSTRERLPSRPAREIENCDGENDRLPDREMERIEPLAPVAADQIEAHHADKVDALDQRDSGGGRDQPCASARRKREDRGNEEKRGLQTIASII